MKDKITDFIHHLLIYDYLLFAGVILAFLLILILAIVLRNRLGLAVFLVLLAFVVLTVGPIVGYLQLHRVLFANTVQTEQIKKLEFTEALLIRGTITNASKRPFSECTLNAGVHKVKHNRYIDPIYPHIPFRKSALVVPGPIEPGKSVPFKLIIEPFRYTSDFNVTLKADCR